MNFDWRRWGEVAFADEVTEEFRARVELCSFTTGEQVTLIAHSMGASVVLYALTVLGDQWTREHIDQVIMCAPAASGTPSLFPDYACGPVASMADILPKQMNHELAAITSTWPCMIAEFPMDIGGIRTFDSDYPFVKTPTKQYRIADVQQFLDDTAQSAIDNGKGADSPFCYGKALWPGMLKIAEKCGPPAVPTHIIYGAGQKTPRQWTYSSNDLLAQPRCTGDQPGDNTVTAISIENMAEGWRKRGCNVTLHQAPDEENHASMIKCDFAIGTIQDILAQDQLVSVTDY